MKFNVYLTIFIHLSGLIHSVQSTQSETCTHDNNITLSCNYIPKDISAGIKKFRLELNTSLILNSFTFRGKHWRRLEYLEFTPKNKLHHLAIVFKDHCMKQLGALNELHISVWNPLVSGSSFSGLDRLRTLDFSGCARLTMQEFLLALNGSDILPELRKVVLSDWNFSYNFHVNFIQTLRRRKITELNVSKSQILYVNLTHVVKELTYLDVVNISYAIIGDFKDKNLTQKDVRHIKMLDFSHAVLPKKTINFPPGKLVVHDVIGNLSELRSPEDSRTFFGPESINISGIIPHISSIWLHNVTVFIDIDPSFKTSSISARQNNLKRADVKMICDIYYFGSIETLDLSDNKMEFLHPSSLSCFRSLISLDLSKNQLYKMVEENNSLFEKLLSGLKYLKYIRMQVNGLHKIPTKLFENRKSIEEIDLSKNSLKQVTFDLGDLEKLEVLDLRGNQIHILDSHSINFLNSLPTGGKDSIILESNPISCSVCEAKTFILWLTSTNLVGTDSRQLSCIDERGKYIIIKDKTVDLVQSICHRMVIRIAVGVSVPVTFVLTIACMMIIYRRKKQLRKNRKRSDVLNNLRVGKGQYQFAVFLSYSSKDEDFVSKYVLNYLNENLQLMTGVDRSLVCTGDNDFRPGFNIHEETFRLLDFSSVFIVVISNNFLTRDACKSEIEKAYGKNKPIGFMLFEHVNCALMNRTIKALFENKTRILWTVENGEYNLKTTWENVCTSVLDLIKEEN